MPEQNLNPDALEAALAALHGDNCPDDPEPGEFCDCDAKSLERMCEVAVSAYFAALPAQPDTVNSVEELDQLPLLTILRDAHGHRAEKWVHGFKLVGQVGTYSIDLPATVLYRPVEG